MCLISGGNWNNNTNAGVWNVNLNNYRTNSNNNIGFRSADFDSFIFPKILTIKSGVIGMWYLALNNIRRTMQQTLLFSRVIENQEKYL